MNDIRYLLSIRELLNTPAAEKLMQRAYEKLDGERKHKLDHITAKRKYAESLGAGLLLQLGLQRMLDAGSKKACQEDVPAGFTGMEIVSMEEILEQLKTPIEATYCYGGNGKPYFQDIPIYFNLSHSEDYVCCVFSEEEVGVDIQYNKPLTNERVVRRFFTDKEQSMFDNCVTQQEREQCFFWLWARKEAYGKLTGEGIVKAVSVEVLENETHDVIWEDYTGLIGYQIAICRRIGKRCSGRRSNIEV